MPGPACPRSTRREGGFSLVELTVVMVVLAALVGIAIATYIGQQAKAQRSTAISTMKSAWLVSETLRADDAEQEWSVDIAALEDEQRVYEWRRAPAPSDGPQVVSVDGDPETHVSFAIAAGGRCFYQRLEIGADRRFTHVEDLDGSLRCSGDEYGLGDPRQSGY